MLINYICVWFVARISYTISTMANLIKLLLLLLYVYIYTYKSSLCIFLSREVCNVTISSRNLAARSGLSWVEIRSPELQGPTSCFWRMASSPGQRIEIQIHRLLSVGRFDNITQT